MIFFLNEMIEHKQAEYVKFFIEQKNNDIIKFDLFNLESYNYKDQIIEYINSLNNKAINILSNGDNDYNILMYAIRNKVDIDIVNAILKSDINLHHTTKNNWNVLQYACRYLPDYDLVKYLIDKGVDINLPNSDKWTAFSIACRCCSPNIIKLFLDKDIDLIVRPNGYDAICLAFEYNIPPSISLLIKHKMPLFNGKKNIIRLLSNNKYIKNIDPIIKLIQQTYGYRIIYKNGMYKIEF